VNGKTVIYFINSVDPTRKWKPCDRVCSELFNTF